MDISYFLSVVIPIYNEEHRIKDTLERVVSYLSEKNFNWELILVNDGSTDRSVDIIEKFKQKSENSFVNSNTGSYRVIILNNNENRGKGYAVRKGILNSCGRYVLFTDADNSVPIEEVEKLLNYLNDGFDIAIGSKGLRESMVIKPRLIRWYVGRIFNFLVRKFMGLNYMDTQCGFKCFDRNSADLIFPLLKINDYSFDVEILYLAKKLNLKVKEVPVRCINYQGSRVNVIKDSIKMLFSITKIKRIHQDSNERFGLVEKRGR